MTSAQDTVLLILTVSAWFSMGWLYLWLCQFLYTLEKRVKDYIRLRYGQRPFLEVLAVYSAILIVIFLYVLPIVIVGVLFMALEVDTLFRKTMTKIGAITWIIGFCLGAIWKRLRT